MSETILIADPRKIDLEPEPIPQRWVLSGQPDGRSKTLVRSKDWTSHLVVWECAAGSFEWQYGRDETIFVISGEAFMLKPNGEERRFAAGDVGFFPAGTACKWRVPDHIKKVAVLREPMWRPLGFGLKAWNKLLRLTGIKSRAALAILLAPCLLSSLALHIQSWF